MSATRMSGLFGYSSRWLGILSTAVATAAAAALAVLGKSSQRCLVTCVTHIWHLTFLIIGQPSAVGSTARVLL